MSDLLPVASQRARLPLALFGAFLMACVVFLAIPLTQLIDADNSDRLTVREAMTLPPPKAWVPPPVVPPEPARPSEPPPDFTPQLTALKLNQLALSLNPNIQSALQIGVVSTGFATEVDAVEAIQTLFTFADLNAKPRIINAPSVVFPRELIRRGVREGRVVALIEIDTKGRARVLKIVAASEPRLVAAAKEVIRKARFTPPKVGGALRTVQGEWPIILRAPSI